MIAADSAVGRPIARTDLRRLSDLLAGNPRAPSEYSLANLMLYRARHSYRLVEGASPFLLGRTYDGVSHAMPLCPLDGATAQELLAHASCIYPLAEPEARLLCAAGDFATETREADADYLYDAARLAGLHGTGAKRAQAERFERLSPRFVQLDPAAARDVLAGWVADAGRGPDHADAHECAEAIERRDELGLDGVSIFLGAAPVAFLLAGPDRAGERTVHFAKGRREHDGVYPWMFARFAGLCAVARLNFEQDLGNAGLARSKRALAPMGRINKFRLRRA